MHAVREGSRIRFFNLVDLANQLEQEKLLGKAGRLAERLVRYTELVVLDELGMGPPEIVPPGATSLVTF